MGKSKVFWIVGAVVVLLLVLAGGYMTFSVYTNRFKKKLFLFASLLEKFKAMQASLAAQGIDIDMTDGWRGQLAQEAAYNAGNSKAHFGLSPHNFGAAFDVAPVVDDAFSWDVSPEIWDAIGQAGKDVGLVWGGEFTTIVDKPHFELAGWRSMNLTLQPNQPTVG
jgi:D-alanyl-D-alanine carboxypeptidase